MPKSKEGSLNIYIIWFLVYNHIWLNLPWDDSHFSTSFNAWSPTLATNRNSLKKTQVWSACSSAGAGCGEGDRWRWKAKRERVVSQRSRWVPNCESICCEVPIIMTRAWRCRRQPVVTESWSLLFGLLGMGILCEKGGREGERKGGVRVGATAIVVGTPALQHPGLPQRGWLLG